ncbi:MAG: preprotein translocase subunit SecA [Rickettsiales bacterium]|nr:preprotein translocase subunit SecA [Rickettsiales bacterium]
MFKFLTHKFFGTSNDRMLKSFMPIVEKINDLEKKFSSIGDDQLETNTNELKAKIKQGIPIDDLLPEAFANVREAAKRTLGQRHFDVQLLGGIILHKGMIAEMKTGEGKTLVATLPAYLNSLSGKSVHVVTVNDYLAKRDATWMGQVFQKLGLSTGFIINSQDDEQKKNSYNCDITYGTNNEFGFDYLRDNMKYSKDQIVQRDFNFAIVDEVDSILIDEARTPLVISGPAEASSDLYKKIDKIISKISSNDYEKDEKSKTITIKDNSLEKVENMLRNNGFLKEGGLYDINNVSIVHHTNQALKANFLFARDVDYLVQNGKVLIIDEFTGRAMEGRRFSDGLHQALEAKENLEVQLENQTLASVTYQNYFRLYDKLSGMTGTAKTEADEFFDIYKLEVVEVPTNQKMIRIDYDDEIYRTKKEKYDAIINQIRTCLEKKQPVLVGTISIENSEYLSRLLKKENIIHNVLNAKNHAQEAEIVQNAGTIGSVTIATNMAGRGTDIQLGGFELTEKQIVLKNDVLNSGGLFIIGTERHESRRIDNQLRGRSGRQGDSGASKFYLSLEDDLMRIFGSDKLDTILQRLGLEEGESIQHPWISKALERAQKKVEGRNFDIRKSLLKFDDVMNEQRKIIYEQRKEIILNNDSNKLIDDMRYDFIDEKVDSLIDNPDLFTDKKEEEISNEMSKYLNIKISFEKLRNKENFIIEDIKDIIKAESDILISKKRVEYSKEVFSMAEKSLLLQTIDKSWKEHLLSLDHLRQGISLRAYGQRDPLNEYQHESFIMFEDMTRVIRQSITQMISHVEIKTEINEPKQVEVKESNRNKSNGGFKNTKISRNAKCPCGSGRKFKNCCGKLN